MTIFYDPGAVAPLGLEVPASDDDPNAGIFGKTWEFDFTTGDFVTDEDGNVQTVEGSAAILQELRKALSTRRYAYLGYPKGYGNDLAAYLANPPAGANTSWLATLAVQELLGADVRISDSAEVDVEVNTGAETGTVDGTITDRLGGTIDLDALPFRFDI